MARKSDLRKQRAGTVINKTSSKQEKALTRAIRKVTLSLKKKFPKITIVHKSQWMLKDIVAKLSKEFPSVQFMNYFNTSSMKPDGGILFLKRNDDALFPILITEKKNQGTNDLRELEGKKRQSRGNAIERLGKNVIGLRTALKAETIFPFICFGDGCDFAEDSSILDRVVTIAQFGELNKTHLHNQGEQGQFDRGSFYFKVEEWKEREMAKIALDVAIRSIQYYFSKYGEGNFNSP